MKKLVIISSLFAVLSGFAQSKPDCEKEFNDFEVYYRKSFNEKAVLTEEGRIKTLNLIQNISKDCPSYNRNIYVFGEEMLLKIIKPMNRGEEYQKWTQYLTEIYDQYSQHFPETRKENTLKKLVVSYNSGVYSSQQAFKSFDDFYKQDKQAFSAEALLIYADLLTSQSLTNQNMSSEYIKKTDDLDVSISSKIRELGKKKENSKNQNEIKDITTDVASLEIASRNISSALKTAQLDCEQWNNLYRDDFQKNKSDVLWLENALSRLDTYKCSANNPFFTEMAETYYALEKTPKSAFYLGNIAQQQQEREKAVTYFNESAELETDKSEKAKLYYRIADFYKRNDKAQAKSFLEKAIENNPEQLESYIVLSQLYVNAGSDCANNEFEQKALNLLAIENMERIIKVNPKYKATAQKTIEGYKEKAPTKDEIRKEKMRGKTVSFGCWINQSITIR